MAMHFVKSEMICSLVSIIYVICTWFCLHVISASHDKSPISSFVHSLKKRNFYLRFYVGCFLFLLSIWFCEKVDQGMLIDSQLDPD